jgi:hypothetical protein
MSDSAAGSTGEAWEFINVNVDDGCPAYVRGYG